MCECIEGFWIVAEVVDIKDRFSVRQIQASKIRVQPRVWRPEIWDSGRGAYPSSCLALSDQYVWTLNKSEFVKRTKTTIRFALPLLIYSATDSTVLLFRVSGGVFSDIGVEASWPILPRQGLPGLDSECLSLRRRPIVSISRFTPLYI